MLNCRQVDRQVFLEATEFAEKFEPEFFEVAKSLHFSWSGGSVMEVFTAIDEAFDVVRQISNVFHRRFWSSAGVWTYQGI